MNVGAQVFRLNSLYARVPNLADTYACFNFGHTQEPMRLKYHQSLPYALNSGCVFGADCPRLRDARWRGFVQKIQSEDKSLVDPPITIYGEYTDSLHTALRDALSLALYYGVVIKLEHVSALSKQVFITALPNDSGNPFSLFTDVTVMEDFFIRDERYFRVRCKEGKEHYIPAACTNYSPHTPLTIEEKVSIFEDKCVRVKNCDGSYDILLESNLCEVISVGEPLSGN